MDGKTDAILEQAITTTLSYLHRAAIETLLGVI